VLLILVLEFLMRKERIFLRDIFAYHGMKGRRVMVSDYISVVKSSALIMAISG
jgi:hypothetical protein